MASSKHILMLLLHQSIAHGFSRITLDLTWQEVQ